MLPKKLHAFISIATFVVLVGRRILLTFKNKAFYFDIYISNNLLKVIKLVFILKIIV